MNCAPPTALQEPAAWHHAMLHKLAAVTLELAEAVQRQAMQQAAAPPERTDTAPGLLFTKLARALRQTIALDGHLTTEERRGAAANPAEHIRRAAAERARKRTARTELRRRLVDCIESDTTRRETEDLFRDLDDRLYDDDIDAALSVTSVTDILLTLCAEFDLKPDYGNFTDAELGMDDVKPPVRRPAAHAHPP